MRANIAACITRLKRAISNNLSWAERYATPEDKPWLMPSYRNLAHDVRALERALKFDPKAERALYLTADDAQTALDMATRLWETRKNEDLSPGSVFRNVLEARHLADEAETIANQVEDLETAHLALDLISGFIDPWLFEQAGLPDPWSEYE